LPCALAKAVARLTRFYRNYFIDATKGTITLAMIIKKLAVAEMDSEVGDDGFGDRKGVLVSESPRSGTFNSFENAVNIDSHER
jgi:hypothetical protein